MQITETIFGNKTCFLSQQEWQSALQSTIKQSLTLYSLEEAEVTLWMRAAYIPNIFQETTNVLLHKGAIDCNLILSRTTALLQQYRDWYSYWQLQLGSAVMESSMVEISENIRRWIELFCYYLQHICIIQRLFTCINPVVGAGLEEETIRSANQILHIYTQYVRSGQPQYRIGISVLVAKGVLATTNQWGPRILNSSTSSTIEPRIFLDWCKTLRRSVSRS